MNQSELKNMTTEELEKKAKGIKTLMWIFVPIILGLLYFTLRDYFSKGEVEMSSVTILICSFGGLVTLFPQFKSVQEELQGRSGRSSE